MGASWHSTNSRVLDVAPVGVDSTLAASEETNRAGRSSNDGTGATASTLACLAGYLLVGEFAYLSRPAVESNMLKSYDPSDPDARRRRGDGGERRRELPDESFQRASSAGRSYIAAFGWGPGRARDGARATPRDADGGVSRAHGRDGVGGGGPRRRFQLVGSTAGVLVICVVPAALLLRPSPTPTPTVVTAFGLEWDDEDGDVVGVGEDRGRSPRRRGRQTREETLDRGRRLHRAGTTSWALGETARLCYSRRSRPGFGRGTFPRSSARSGADARGTSRKRWGSSSSAR